MLSLTRDCNMWKSFLGWFAKYVINPIGNIQVFKWPLFFIICNTHYKIKGKHSRKILDLIQPGDILLRRYDTYISSFLIPGFWDHAALYIGKNKVIHAVGSGVTEEDILTFIRTDHIMILRVLSNKTRKAVRVAIQRAKDIESEGAEYDFDFTDTNKFCCTELVYHCYHDCSELDMKIRDTGITKGRILGDDFLKFNLDVVYNSLEHDKF